MCEWDDDVLIDEDEQSEEEAQPDRAQRVHSWQLIKWREVEDRAVMDAEHRNWQDVYRKHPITYEHSKVKKNGIVT